MSAEPQITALGDATRRAAFLLVVESPRSVKELADVLPVTRPAVSQHLKVLSDAGLVTASSEGTRRIYRANPGGLAELRRWLDQQWEHVLDDFENAARKEEKLLSTDKIQPVTKRRIVGLAPAAAFELFTARISEWWPTITHSIHAEDVTAIRFEGRVGGRLVEVAGDGTEVSWAEVLAWDPPNRFALSWHPNPDPIAASILEVRFSEAPDGGTELLLEHRGWEEFGTDGPELRQQYDAGWEVVLEPFQNAAG